MGHDGKTGETLLKSVLAPMFAARNLQVMSWVGHNIFGNMDGKVLDDPANKQAKVASKDHLLQQILGYTPQTLVSIEYIESLGDWKTAWDHIHFQRLPRHADDAAVHLARLRFAAGRAAGDRPGPPHRTRPSPRRARPADLPGQLLQKPPRRRASTTSCGSSRCWRRGWRRWGKTNGNIILCLILYGSNSLQPCFTKSATGFSAE